jgi:hypothetical protein
MRIITRLNCIKKHSLSEQQKYILHLNLKNKIEI